MSKASSILGSLSQMICDAIHMSAVFALRLIRGMFGFLRQNLHSCTQEVKEAAYKGLVRPVLEYSGSVWDPSGVGLQNELEKVHNRAARFVIGNYNFETGNMTGILEHLKWESLKKRRRHSRLILLYKGLKGKVNIPIDDLIPLVRRCRNDHSMAYQVPIANTDIYKCSFLPQTIRKYCSDVSSVTILILTSCVAVLLQNTCNTNNRKWASSWDYGTYHIGDQRRLRQASTSAQPRQSLHYLHMKYGSRCENQTSSPTGWLRMHVWRMSLRRTESTIISRLKSVF